MNDINKAVDAAKEAFKIYSLTEIDERIILLKKISPLYELIIISSSMLVTFPMAEKIIILESDLKLLIISMVFLILSKEPIDAPPNL